ncbi:MAG: redox-sensing transcriptional repressor [Desulfovibrionales bacterium]|jgi:redox-sensing transcriptional repressor|nr:redox-sensing transcriptional repressor [Desulfovibrionales bacterium]
MKHRRIPKATIDRMAVYLEVLENFSRDGAELVSSDQLAKACKSNPAQIRKDLAYFGDFGIRGVGYAVESLKLAIKRALSIDGVWRCALFGAGNLGRALLGNREFVRRGFHIQAVFDCDPDKLGLRMFHLAVQSPSRLGHIVKEQDIQIGIITTPPNRAQRAANHLVEADIKGIVTFAPTRINVPDEVSLQYVDLFRTFYSLSFDISLREQEAAEEQNAD